MRTREIADVIGTNVRRLREGRGWTQAQLARRVREQGIRTWSPGTVGLVETGGQRADRLADLLALSLAFHVDIAELVAPTGTADAVNLGGPAPVELSRIQSWVRGMLPDEEGEPSTYYTEAEDPYDMARIARSVDIDSIGDFRLVTYAVFGRSFLELRDERAGIGVTPGDRASIQHRRGAASRTMLAEIREAIELNGVEKLKNRAIAMLQEAAK